MSFAASQEFFTGTTQLLSNCAFVAARLLK
jgi:hypothetical protein